MFLDVVDLVHIIVFELQFIVLLLLTLEFFDLGEAVLLVFVREHICVHQVLQSAQLCQKVFFPLLLVVNGV